MASLATAAAARLEALVALSTELGEPRKDYVILAEGNTSARIDEHSFWVKASGKHLERADANSFVAMRLEPVMALLRDPSEVGDGALRAAFLDARLDGGGDGYPSIETFLHAVCLELGGAEFVAHTHPTALNKLLCARDAEALLRGTIFPDEAVVCGPEPLFVPYTEPGLPLGRALLAGFQAFLDQHGQPPRAVMLGNHGLVTLGATAAEAAAITAMAVKAARVRLGALLAGGSRPLTADQVARLVERQDEVERRQTLMAAPEQATHE
jgi:rhamnose utilization protein RhaD (predicted bifunctional aldolase and dehydrogenase)